jgi:hypothetical protein
MELSQCLEKHVKGIIGNIQFLKTSKDMEIFNESMKKIYKAWDSRQRKINTLQAQSFRVGDAVTFKNNKGLVQNGVVKKVKIKNVVVETDSGDKWNVPASFLELLELEVA